MTVLTDLIEDMAFELLVGSRAIPNGERIGKILQQPKQHVQKPGMFLELSIV